MGAARQPLASLLGVAVAWTLWVYASESVDGRRMTGMWSRLSTADSEAACERKLREQVQALLNALAPLGASVDKGGEAVFYTEKGRGGRPVMKGLRYECLPDDVDPSGGGR
jgi:hypothetical protein